MHRLHIIKEQISQTDKPLKGKTVVITGASRGIGLAIGIRCAQDGANVAILAKTVTPQPTLEGTQLLKQELFSQLQLILRRLEAKDCRLLATFVTSKV